MRLDDAILMQYADGELSPEQAAGVEDALAGDPELAARVERFRSVRTALKKVYDSVVDEPIPEHLRALLGDVATHEPPPPKSQPVAAPAPGIADVAASSQVRQSFPLGAPALAAIAASLIIGVLVGRLSAPAASGVFTTEGGGLRASAALASVLDTRLASAPENSDAATRIGLSFRTEAGQLCRTFSHNDNARGVSGLACRDGGGWTVRIAETTQSDNSRQAGVSAPAVLAMVDMLIDGEPLDAAEERVARERGWRD